MITRCKRHAEPFCLPCRSVRLGDEEAYTGGAPRCCRISGPKTTGDAHTAPADREEQRRWTADVGRRLVVFHKKTLHNVSRRTRARPAASVLSRMLSPLNARAGPDGLKRRWGRAARGPKRRHTGGPASPRSSPARTLWARDAIPPKGVTSSRSSDPSARP